MWRYNDIMYINWTIYLILTFSCSRYECTPPIVLCLGSLFTVPWWAMGESLGCVTLGLPGLPEWRSNSRAPDPARATHQWSVTRVMCPHQRTWPADTMSALDFDDVSIGAYGQLEYYHLHALQCDYKQVHTQAHVSHWSKEKSLNLIKLTIHTSPLLSS